MIGLSKTVILAAALASCCMGFSSPVMADTGDPVLINEVLAYHAGAVDNCEFVELYGTPGASLDGLSIVVVRGTSIYVAGRISLRIDLGPEHELGPNGFFLLGNPQGLDAMYGILPDFYLGSNDLYNSSITIGLIETSSLTSEVGEDVTNEEVAQDAIGLASNDPGSEFYFGASVLGPSGPFFPAGARRIEDGVDTNRRADWTFASFDLPGDNTPTCSGPALPVERATWGALKRSYR